MDEEKKYLLAVIQLYIVKKYLVKIQVHQNTNEKVFYTRKYAHK
jgi:hypothetical protein